jgi:hypothetical protein
MIDIPVIGQMVNVSRFELTSDVTTTSPTSPPVSPANDLFKTNYTKILGTHSDLLVVVLASFYVEGATTAIKARGFYGATPTYISPVAGVKLGNFFFGPSAFSFPVAGASSGVISVGVAWSVSANTGYCRPVTAAASTGDRCEIIVIEHIAQ